MKRDERGLELRVQRLRKEVIARVRYQRSLQVSALEHAVEHAIYLDCASGLRVAIACDDMLGTHHGFGVNVSERKMIDDAFGEVVDVTDSDAWSPLVGRAVEGASVRWDDVLANMRSSLASSVMIHADYLRRRDFPAAIELLLGNRTVSFAAARRSETGEIVAFVNALLVTFTSR